MKMNKMFADDRNGRSEAQSEKRREKESPSVAQSLVVGRGARVNAVAWPRCLRALALIALLAFGTFAAQAVSPSIRVPAAVAPLEDTSTNISIVVTDTVPTSVTVTVSLDDSNICSAVLGAPTRTSTTATYVLALTGLTNANGSFNVSVVATNATNSATSSFPVTVRPVNDKPSFTLSAASVTVSEDAGSQSVGSFLTGLSAGPSDESAQTWAFTVSLANKAAFKTAPAISSDGTLTFQTVTNYYGSNWVTVVMKDTGGTANGGKDSATNYFSLVVTGGNDTPMLVGLKDTTILEDVSTNRLTFSISDPDSTSFHTSVTSSDTGLVAVSISADTGTNRTLSFTPVANSNGVATITVTVDDGTATNTGSFKLTVSPVDDPPSFAVSTNKVMVIEDAGSQTIANFLTTMSTGPANESAQTWTFAVSYTNKNAFAAAPAISTDGTLTFKTATNYYGSNWVTVVMKDNGGSANGGKDSATNYFALVVSAANDTPWLVGLKDTTILEDVSTNKLAFSISDPDSSSFHTSVASSDTSLVAVSVSANTGTNRTLSFTPVANSNGVATITVTVDDGTATNTSSFKLTVSSVNDQPSFALSTNKVMVAEDAGGQTNASFVATMSAGPANEAAQTWTFTVTCTNKNAFALAPMITTNGTLIYRTATNYNGSNWVTVVMKDSGGTANGGKDSATNYFSLVVSANNDTPDPIGLKNTTILEDVTTNTLKFTIRDVDSSSFTATVTSSDTNLVGVSISGTGTNRTLAFTPVANSNGVATITVTVDDGSLTNTSSFKLTITPVNDQPSFVSEPILDAVEDSGLKTFVGFATNMSAGPPNESAQTWTFSAITTNAKAFAVPPAVSTNGTLTFKTATNYFGDFYLKVVMKDSGGTANRGKDSVTNSLHLYIYAQYDTPYLIGVKDTTILEDVTTNTLKFTISDPDSTNFSTHVTSSDTSLVDVDISGTGTNRTITFTPQTNATGTATITIAVDDGDTGRNVNFKLTVSPVNDAPSFDLSTNKVTVVEDAGGQTNANFLTNISTGPTNESAQTWTFTATCASKTAFALGPMITTNGTLIFKTATNYSGSNWVTLVMKDSGGTANRGKDAYTNYFAIVVTATNDTPWLVGLKDTTILEDIGTNTLKFSIADSDSSSFHTTVTSSDTNLVAAAISADTGTNRTLSFTPVAASNGVATITVTVDDGTATNTGSFKLTVSPVNDQPSFVLSTNKVMVLEDAGGQTNASFLTSLSAGPPNESAQTWTFTVTCTNKTGFAVAPMITTNGTLIYKTATNYNGSNWVTVVMKDSAGTANGGKDSYTNRFAIVVTAANDTPWLVGLKDTTILEDISTNTLKFSIADPDSSSFHTSVISSDTNLVAVSISADTGTNRTLSFTPVAASNGVATITVTVDDGTATNTGSFKLTVSPVNDQPSFVLSTNKVMVVEDAGGRTNANFLTSLSAGPPNESAQTWTFTVTCTNKTAFAVAPMITTNGTLIYKTATNYNGSNWVTVVMKDSAGTVSGGKDSFTNYFSLVVSANNDTPDLIGLKDTTILEDVSTNTLKFTIRDVDSSSFTTIVASSDTNLVDVSISGTGTNRTLAFTPVANSNGLATVTVTVDDGTLTNTASFKLTITPVNDQPSFAVSTNKVMVVEDAGGQTNANFLTSLSAGPSNEAVQTWTFTVTCTNKNAFAVAPLITTNGTLIYKSATNYNGSNWVTVVMKDSGGTANGGKDSATNYFAIVVAATNDTPWLVGLKDTAILEDVSTNTLKFTISDPDSSSFHTSVTSSDTNLVEVSVSADTGTNRTLSFTPVANSNGLATITVTVDDGTATNTGSFKLTVSPVNDQPSFAVSTNKVMVIEDAGGQTNASFLTSISAGPTNESAQTWTFTVTCTNTTAFALAPQITTNGTLIFKTVTNYYGSNWVTVVMKDSGGTASGGKDSATNYFALVVTATNDTPWLVGLKDTTILEDVTTNTLKFSISDPDSSSFHTSVTSSDTNLVAVSVSADTGTNRTLTFTPVANSNGLATITVTVDDGTATNTGSFKLTVSPVNDQPAFTLSTNLVTLAEDAGAQTTTNFLTGISVGPANESDQTNSFTVTTTNKAAFAAGPSISPDGTLTFTTATNYNGTNWLTIVMKDSGATANGGKDTSTNSFTLIVTPVNDAPVISGLADKTIREDAKTNIVFSILDPDSTNFNLSVACTNSSLVSVALSGTGSSRTLQCTTVTNAFGSAYIAVTVDDGSLTNTTSFVLTVASVNDAPSFSLTTTNVNVSLYSVAVSMPNMVTNISSGPTNESEQTVSFVVSNSASSLFTVAPAIAADGTLTFTPKPIGGTVTVTVRAKDDAGTQNGGVDTSAGQTFTITIPANPFVPLKGNFAGLFFKTNTGGYGNASAGYFQMALATNGTFTGSLQNAGTSSEFSGQFGAATPTASITNDGYVLNLTLDTTTNATESVSGTVANAAGGWTVPLLGFLNVNSSSSPASLRGEYLMALPGNSDPTKGPSGYSLLSLTVSNTGVVALGGVLSDDTRVYNQDSQISRGGHVPLYIGLGANSSVCGWLNFTSNGTTRVSSDSVVAWVKESGGTYYASGFTNSSVPLVSPYNENAVNLLSATSGTVILSGGNLSTPITNSITISSNIITVDLAATNGLALTMDAASGQVLGQFTAPGGETRLVYSVILQSTNKACGYFMGTSQGGSFILHGN